MADLVCLFEVRLPELAAGLAVQPAAFLAAPREAMLRTLTALRWDHGGAAAFLVANGLPDSSLQRLRHCLVA